MGAVNFCEDCGDELLEPVEWRYGFCALCLSIEIDKFEGIIQDYWFDDEWFV